MPASDADAAAAGPSAPASRVAASLSIRGRLVLAFLLVAVLSVGLVATLAVIFGEKDLSTLAAQRRTDLVRSLVADAVSAYNTGTPGWSDADLQPALLLARHTGADIAVVAVRGRTIAATNPTTAADPRAEQVPIRLRDERIGTLAIRFHDRGIDASVGHLQGSLLVAVIAAAVVACGLALFVAAVLARRITRPIARLIEVARAVGSGDRSARVGPVDAPGEVQELTATFDAMTDTLVQQEQLRRDLVADVAHELRTPVAVLQASCEAMLDGVTPPSITEIESLHEEALRLAALVDDLQTMAAADAAALHLQLERIDLADVAVSAADALAPRFLDAQVDLTRSTEPAPMRGDPQRLRQVVLNLLTNALKFTPAQGRITLAIHRTGARVELVVSDTGCGIAEEDLPHVFDRFWRGGNAAGTTGSGIGLAVVAQLVRAHGGTVGIRSEVSSGTTVTVTLPGAD